MLCMAFATRVNRSLSLEKTVLHEVERSKGAGSTSERVNELLKIALEVERAQRLAEEAKSFFRSVSEEDRTSRKAFQAATVNSLARED